MESKDVQQLFKDVLGSAEREQQLNCVGAEAEAGVIRDPSRAQLASRPFLQSKPQYWEWGVGWGAWGGIGCGPSSADVLNLK